MLSSVSTDGNAHQHAACMGVHAMHARGALINNDNAGSLLRFAIGVGSSVPNVMAHVWSWV